MATTLYLRDALTDRPFPGYYPQGCSSALITGYADTARPVGASAGSDGSTFTATATTVNGPYSTGVVPRFTAASVPIWWVTPPVASSVTISGTVSFDIWASESSMSANATVYALLNRMNPDGTNSLIAAESYGTELGTSPGLKSWTDTPTSTTLDRTRRVD